MKLAIITGGSKGLGKGLFEQLGEMGYQMIELSRSAPYEVSHKIDLANPLEARQTAEKVVADLDDEGLEELLIINNAAVNVPVGPAVKQDAADILMHLNVNMVSQILVLSAVMAKFKETVCPKLIANITSGAANSAFEGMSLYCATKAGMEQFVRTTAAEQAREAAPFMLINVDPSVMDTDMQTIMRGVSEEDFPAVERFVAMKEEGNLYAPADTAGAIIRILTSDDLVNGERYHVSDFR